MGGNPGETAVPRRPQADIGIIDFRKVTEDAQRLFGGEACDKLADFLTELCAGWRERIENELLPPRQGHRELDPRKIVAVVDDVRDKAVHADGIGKQTLADADVLFEFL